MIPDKNNNAKQYLLMSDFDQTLSFNDSGLVLSEMLGISGFEKRVLVYQTFTWCSKVANCRTCCYMIRSFAGSGKST